MMMMVLRYDSNANVNHLWYIPIEWPDRSDVSHFYISPSRIDEKSPASNNREDNCYQNAQSI